MNLSTHLKKLKSSEQFKRFIKENPKAFLCSGFFVIDKEGSDNKKHFDYYIEDKKQIFSFQLEDEIKLVELETTIKETPRKLEAKNDFDFEEIEKLINEKAKQEGIKNKLQKMMFSLQEADGKEMIIGTVFLSSLGLLQLKIDLSEMKITNFEKKSFFDMVKIIKKK